MSSTAALAFDLGAESGRAMLVSFDDQRVELTELHRFANLPQRLPSGWHWNLLELWRNLQVGLAKAVDYTRQRDIELASLGVDTWGVDYGLIGRSGQLLAAPYCYRDPRTDPVFRRLLDEVGAERLYDRTGIQLMSINTLYQLIATHEAEPGLLAQTDRMLNMPDLLHYFFTGEASHEATIASTTQMIDPRSGDWAGDLLQEVGLPDAMLGPTTPAGSTVGVVREPLRAESGVGPLPVIAPGCHDTASAVAATPATGDRPWAFLSSGTWSLMGVELDEPVIGEASRAAGLTNERGVAGRIRFLKNISGLWLVQQCRRAFAAQGEDYDYADLTRLAAEAPPFRTLIDSGYGPFAQPGGMLEKIAAYADKTAQPAPTTPGEFVRCCLESLALTYRRTLDQIDQILGRRTEVLHILGGGGRNELLNQLTADALNRPVLVGPEEATALGNGLTQAIGLGMLEDLDALRARVRQSISPRLIEPQRPSDFDAPLARLESYLGMN